MQMKFCTANCLRNRIKTTGEANFQCRRNTPAKQQETVPKVMQDNKE